MRKKRVHIERYKVITFVRVEYNGKLKYVIDPNGIAPSNRYRKELTKDQFIYATKEICPVHKYFARVCYLNLPKTLRYVDSHKCVKCCDAVAEKTDNYGRPYRYKIEGEYFHRLRPASNQHKIDQSATWYRLSSNEFPDWIDFFKDCE